MDLVEFLNTNREELLGQWTQDALGDHSSDFSERFKKSVNQFANPMAFSIANALASLFDHLAQSGEIEKIQKSLDEIVRIRAVQEMEPSKALSFVLSLKGLVRKKLAKEIKEKSGMESELVEFENRMDQLAMLAFDIYMTCREQVFQIKIDEIKSGVFVNEPDGAACPSALMDSWSQ